MNNTIYVEDLNVDLVNESGFDEVFVELVAECAAAYRVEVEQDDHVEEYRVEVVELDSEYDVDIVEVEFAGDDVAVTESEDLTVGSLAACSMSVLQQNQDKPQNIEEVDAEADTELDEKIIKICSPLEKQGFAMFTAVRNNICKSETKRRLSSLNNGLMGKSLVVFFAFFIILVLGYLIKVLF